MTFGRRTPEPYDSAEAAQLQRDIVGTVVHDLASITGALALRVEASGGTLGERDVSAVATLTTQLRTATRPLVWLRGSPGRGMLAPVRNIEVATWWQHTSQVAYSLLPHGTRIMPAAADVTPASGNALSSDDLTLFGMLVLGTCRHFVDADPAAAISLDVTLPTVEDSQPMICLELTPVVDAPLETMVKRPTRWKRFCMRTAARAGATLNWWQPVDGPSAKWRWSVTRNTLSL